MSNTGTIHVAVEADLLTYATAAATVLAALLALLSILYSARQARKAERLLLRERRADFELGLLAEMGRQFGITGVQHLHGHLVALIRSTSPPDDLPALRAHFGRYPTPLGQERLAQARNGDGLHDAVRLEIEEAIERRMAP